MTATAAPPPAPPPNAGDAAAVATSRRRAALVGTTAVLVLAAAVALVTLSGYAVRDPDSRLYVALSSDLAARPVAAWSAPEWNGHWRRSGRFYEHPPGLLWLGAGLQRLGLAPYPSLYLVNFAALLVSLGLVARIGRTLGGPAVGSTAPLLWALTPAFIQYLVRANHENLLAALVLAGLLALTSLERRSARALAFGGALAAAVLVKGAAGAALLGVAGLVWLGRGRRLAELVELAAGVAVAVAAAGALELWHEAATGASFWSSYVRAQVRAAVGVSLSLEHTARNLLFYTVRPLWFFFPWILLVGWVAVRWLRGTAPAARRPAFLLGVAALLLYIAGFSLGRRHGDRYLFPVYPLLAVSAASALQILEAPFAQRLRRFIERHGVAVPYALLGAVLLGIIAKVWIGMYHYVRIDPWKGG